MIQVLSNDSKEKKVVMDIELYNEIRAVLDGYEYDVLTNTMRWDVLEVLEKLPYLGEKE